MIALLPVAWVCMRRRRVRRRAIRELMRLTALRDAFPDDDELKRISTDWACFCGATFTCTKHLAMRELKDRRLRPGV